ncbi:MAG: hypothetical protein R3Y57_01200 [Erysipelotrichaceae bacterium]
MNKISAKNIAKLTKFNLFTTRKVIIGWTVCLFAIMSLYMILFPTVQDIAQVKFELMPTELLQFVGMEDLSDMSNYMNYYGIIYGIILIAISIFATTYSSGLIIKEEKTKSIEFLNSLFVSKTEIFIAKYFTSTIAIALVATACILSVIGCGLINGGETFSLVDVFYSAKITSFTPLLFGVIALMLSGISYRYGTPAISSMVVVTSYMLGYLGQLLGDKAEWLLYFSPFITLSVEKAIALSNETMIMIGVYLFIYLSSIIIGCIAYQKRDLVI